MRRWAAATALLLLGTVLLLLGLALSLDDLSLRNAVLMLPARAPARLVFRIYAALQHHRAQVFEATLAALGGGVVLMAVCLAARRRAALRIVAGMTGLAALVSALAVGTLVLADREGVVAYGRLRRSHVPWTIDSPRLPPPGGVHAPRWQNCGVYDTPLPNANAVHSLEHGVVWLTYRPDLDPGAVRVLRALARQGDHRLLSPYPDQLAPIVATAWGYQLLVDRANDPRLARFISRHERAPWAPEPGAPCSDGVGQPLH
jgi:hypothetical protein